MVDVQKALAPGVRQIDLSAQFVRRAFELGATANMLEPIWQVMPTTQGRGPWTTHGDLALPLLTTERELAAGDVLWTDVSITYSGYCSDFGRTWVVGEEPTARQQAQFRQWRDILDAVLDGDQGRARRRGDLARAAIAANGGQKPWLPHFYLGHGIGTNAAEMPMIGTDLGEEFDDNFVFPAGMVLVLEPVVWEDGTGGYRSEEIVVITEDGCVPLTDYPYDPYGQTEHEILPDERALRLGPARARAGSDGGPRPRRAGARAAGQRPLRLRARRSCGSPAPGRSARSAPSCGRPGRSI